jgi:sugar lactone lactonase YvrE
MAVACGVAHAARPLPDVTIEDTNVYPESISSTANGTLFAGSVKGIIFRAAPGSSTAQAWITPSEQNGLLSVFGVLADERSGTLWICSTPSPLRNPPSVGTSALMAFDLKSGKQKGAYPFPGPPSVCNDVTIARDGTALASDTANGRILKLARGAKALEVYAEDARLKGIDGLVFDRDGTLYVNIVTKGLLLRIDRNRDGSAGAITQLTTSEPLRGPDGFRLVRPHTFLLAEGNGGRIDEVTIDGDQATLKVLRDGLNSPTAVTLIGQTAYANEGKIGFLIDPKLKGQDPGAFVLHAVPLPDSH